MIIDFPDTLKIASHNNLQPHQPVATATSARGDHHDRITPGFRWKGMMNLVPMARNSAAYQDWQDFYAQVVNGAGRFYLPVLDYRDGKRPPPLDNIQVFGVDAAAGTIDMFRENPNFFQITTGLSHSTTSLTRAAAIAAPLSQYKWFSIGDNIYRAVDYEVVNESNIFIVQITTIPEKNITIDANTPAAQFINPRLVARAMNITPAVLAPNGAYSGAIIQWEQEIQ